LELEKRFLLGDKFREAFADNKKGMMGPIRLRLWTPAPLDPCTRW